MKNFLDYFFMYSAFFIYSLSSIFSKIASKQQFLSKYYIICFCIIICIMILYAIIWQKVLKLFPLSIAMANKPVVLIFSLIWAYLFFHESISLKTILGIIIILIGLIFVSLDKKGKA